MEFPVGTPFEDETHKYKVIALTTFAGSPQVRLEVFSKRLNCLTDEYHISPEFLAELMCENNFICNLEN